MNSYKVKVIEKHSDYVWVKADTEEEAKDKAMMESECEFEFVYDCEIITVEQSND